jgi:twitching motility protein PilT
MEKLNEYLQTLLSSCSYALHLEPDKNPYIVSSAGSTDVANAPMLGTQISMMVFPLIPADVKMQLPNKQEIEFVHPHALGNFNFSVRKSPSGFLVTVRPMLPDALPDQAVENSIPPQAPLKELNVPYLTAEPLPAGQEFDDSAQLYTLESSSAGMQNSPRVEVNAYMTPEIEVEEPEYIHVAETIGSQTPIEVVSVNDPQFTTTFSNTSAYEPPGTRDDRGYEPGPSVEESSKSQPDVQFQNPSLASAYEEALSYEPLPPPYETSATNIPHPATPPPVYAPAPEPAKAAFVPVAPSSSMKARMDDLFHKMEAAGASDLHMSVSMPPMVRKDGKMKPLDCLESTMTKETMKDLLSSIMPVKNQEEFDRRHDTDFAYEIPGLARFRANIFMDRKGMGGVFRVIPTKILTAEQLGLSKAIMDLCTLSKGLVVVTGPTGSGKSTTLCAMMDSINKSREDHVITIEDPIEFVHDNHKCLVNQREVHNHTDSFKDALRAALREDPDILLVGEMRDLETIAIAIETAETGHLVFGTLHTTTAASTIDRIIDQFPADRQQQIRVMLSESLKGVIAQTLLPKKGGGRVAALEVLIVTPAISNLIREGKTFQIPSAMQTGKLHGMVMLNDALFELVQKGLVEPLDAYIKAVDKHGFETQLKRGGFNI